MKANTLNSRRFCVVVHDVTPNFRTEIEAILDLLHPVVGRSIAGALVPCWHGRQADANDRQQFQDWAARFGELLLHGCTHYRQRRAGIVSWLTGRSDELSGLSANEISEVIETAQVQAESILGYRPRGFVAPAWQFPASISIVHAAGIDYRMGFWQLTRATAAPIRLATWSWDWGWLPFTSRAGAFLGACRAALFPGSIATVVLHPLDVRRGQLQHAVRLIQKFLHAGWKPVLPSEVADCVSSGACV